jgi:hypothetical protein
MLCLVVVARPPDKNPFDVKINNNINIFGREHKYCKDKRGNYSTGQKTEW